MSACDHEGIRKRRAPGQVIGIHKDAVEELELVNCPGCGTTLARPVVYAKHLDVKGKPLCGVDPAGALVVEEPVHVDCPTCLIELSNLLRSHASC